MRRDVGRRVGSDPAKVSAGRGAAAKACSTAANAAVRAQHGGVRAPAAACCCCRCRRFTLRCRRRRHRAAACWRLPAAAFRTPAAAADRSAPRGAPARPAGGWKAEEAAERWVGERGAARRGTGRVQVHDQHAGLRCSARSRRWQPLPAAAQAPGPVQPGQHQAPSPASHLLHKVQVGVAHKLAGQVQEGLQRGGQDGQRSAAHTCERWRAGQAGASRTTACQGSWQRTLARPQYLLVVVVGLGGDLVVLQVLLAVEGHLQRGRGQGGEGEQGRHVSGRTDRTTAARAAAQPARQLPAARLSRQPIRHPWMTAKDDRPHSTGVGSCRAPAWA